MLSDQLTRSSRSVIASIAEGHGRHHFQDNIQFCPAARGSLVELYDHLSVAMDEGYLTKANFEKLVLKYEQLIKMQNGYIT